MDSRQLEINMRRHEPFHTNTLVPDTYTILRMDGVNFGELVQHMDFERPFDPDFHRYMVETTRYLVSEFHAIYGATHSDEISILLPRKWNFYDRLHEKIISIAPSLCGAAFSIKSDTIASFDARAYSYPSDEGVVDYFRWRQQDSIRNAINSISHYYLVDEQKKTPLEASEILHNKGFTWKVDFMRNEGIDFNTMPAWKKRGSAIVWEKFQKEAFDPKANENVLAKRRRLKVVSELPMNGEYAKFLQAVLNANGNS